MIALDDRITRWAHYGCPEAVALFVHLLFMANEKDEEWRGRTISRGSLVISRNELAKVTGLTYEQVRYNLKKLENSNFIHTLFPRNECTITICDYDSYEVKKNSVSKKFPNCFQELSKNKEETKKVTKEKEKKTPLLQKKNISIEIQKEKGSLPSSEDLLFGLADEALSMACEKKIEFAKFVKLTQKENDSLVRQFGQEDTQGVYQWLSLYKIEQGKQLKYKSDYLVILRWAMDAYYTHKNKKKSTQNNQQTEAYSDEKYWGR